MRIYDFKGIIGNAVTLNMIKTSLSSGSFPHLSINAGAYGTGKSSCAEISALALTCDSLEHKPCLSCPTCKKNIKALQTTGFSTNISKKNFGKADRKDILEILKEVFILESPIGNNVYIFEEFDSLDSRDQGAFLEEIDRLPANTYIIICTNKYHKIIADIRSRAITFNFQRLGLKDMELLFDLHSKKINPKVRSMIITKSHGVPRDMVNLLDFVSSNTKVSLEDIQSFLGVIETEHIISLFYCFKTDLPSTLETLAQLQETFDINTIAYYLKDFCMKVLFYREGNITSDFTKENLGSINEIFTGIDMQKLCKLMDKVHITGIDDVDFRYLIFKIYSIVNNRTTKDTLTENSRDAYKQVKKNESLGKEITKKNVEEGFGNTQDSQSLLSYFK